MKRLSFVFLLALAISISATACSSATSETNDGMSASVSAEASNGGAEGEDVKPEFLTIETFKEKIWDYENNPQQWVYEGAEPAIIDFYADWCKPCKMVAPILDEISKDYQGQVKVYKIDTQVQRELAQVFQVTSIPTFLFIPADGQPQMDRGFKDKAAFEKIIADVLNVK